MKIVVPNLTNDLTYYARQFPQNKKKQFQTRPNGAVVSGETRAGILLNQLPVGTIIKAESFSFGICKITDTAVELVDMNTFGGSTHFSNSNTNNSWRDSTLRAFGNFDYYNALPELVRKILFRIQHHR